MITRGFFGIGIYHTKTETNVGTLWRSAYNFGASFIFTIGKRYKYQSSDTVKTWNKIPLYHYIDYGEFKKNVPYSTQIVAIEQNSKSRSLLLFQHHHQCIYLLGAEDRGIPGSILEDIKHIVHIDTLMCLNVSVAGSIVMYDRMAKMGR
jgi:tRNA(Leu) C34 or U34 (ribose-2'-O)-methylase TrmL